MHNWQVWHHNRPFDAYYAYSPRFCSEFGYQSFPSMEVAETFATREQIFSRAPEFEWHQKNPGGNERIRKTFARYFPEPKDVPSELLLSQFQQAMAIQTAVDAWRSEQPRCMGTLFWQINDNWPVHALEKEMATHSSVLAWRIPGAGEPGGLPSMGSHRVGHD